VQKKKHSEDSTKPKKPKKPKKKKSSPPDSDASPNSNATSALTPGSSTRSINLNGNGTSATGNTGNVECGMSDEEVKDMLDQVNALRAEKNAAPLKINQKLMTVAYKYSQVQAKLCDYGHEVDGTTIKSRIAAGDYNGGKWGENVAAGQETVTEAMNWWRNSQGHYENIIAPEYTEIGFGKFVNKDCDGYGEYWTQDFGNPK
jgi:uncharacterized protein YkwD